MVLIIVGTCVITDNSSASLSAQTLLGDIDFITITKTPPDPNFPLTALLASQSDNSPNLPSISPNDRLLLTTREQVIDLLELRLEVSGAAFVVLTPKDASGSSLGRSAVRNLAS